MYMLHIFPNLSGDTLFDNFPTDTWDWLRQSVDLCMLGFSSRDTCILIVLFLYCIFHSWGIFVVILSCIVFLYLIKTCSGLNKNIFSWLPRPFFGTKCTCPPKECIIEIMLPEMKIHLPWAPGNTICRGLMLSKCHWLIRFLIISNCKYLSEIS